MTPTQAENFNRLLRPRHIAFVGGRDASIAIREARRRGFSGQMWAVNPKRDDLEGVPCFASIADLPEAPDAVYLAIPASAAVDAIRSLSEMGAGGVVCFTAGFKEAGQGDAEKALIEAAGEMAVIGPNCYGLINYIDNSALWSFEHGGWSPGYGAAIITQSGMFSSDITMSQRSLPMAYMVSAGNQAVLGLEDFLEVFSDDPNVRAIGMHIEGLSDIAKFERSALKAIERGIPVVALKSGTSKVGASLTISHTGSLSGSNELYEALFARTGVISVTNPSQFLETLKLLCVVGAPQGGRVAGFTCSGGGATMLADHGEKIGLCFPKVSEPGQTILENLLPEIATVSNPLDYTTPIWGQPEHTYPVFAEAIKALDADVAVLVQDYPAPGLDASKIYYQKDAAAFARAAKENNLPAAITATIPENLDAETREYLIAEGLAPMQGIHETLNAFQQAATWAKVRNRISETPPDPLFSPCGPSILETLDEAQSKAWLQKVGFNVPAGRLVQASNAAEAAEAVGYPAVLKMIGPRLAHKTEAGAVRLNISSTKEMEQSTQRMVEQVKKFDPEAVTDSFLVENMSLSPVAELIVTLRRDPQFGHSLVLGTGGVLVELLQDAVTLLLPTRENEIVEALEKLRSAPLLKGFRGKDVVDLRCVAMQIHELCQSYLRHCDQIAEIEINPMFVYPDKLVAVDALIHSVVNPAE